MGSALLKLKRFKQLPGQCATAAAATVANFYNKKITYEFVRTLTKPTDEGLYTPEIGSLLNRIGFTKVTIITADLHQFDFKWADLSKPTLVKHLTRFGRYGKDWEDRYIARQYRDFLNDSENDNQIVIDGSFGQHIRKTIDEGKPLLLNFNFNLFFRLPKTDDQERNDPLRGNYTQHEVAVRGYDESGVYIVDSHTQLYKGKLAKYKSGRYKMDWETLHTVMGFGDLIVPESYCFDRANELMR